MVAFLFDFFISAFNSLVNSFIFISFFTANQIIYINGIRYGAQIVIISKFDASLSVNADTVLTRREKSYKGARCNVNVRRRAMMKPRCAPDEKPQQTQRMIDKTTRSNMVLLLSVTPCLVYCCFDSSTLRRGPVTGEVIRIYRENRLPSYRYQLVYLQNELFFFMSYYVTIVIKKN